MQGFTFRIGNASNGTYQKFALDLDIAGIWPVWSPGGKKIMFSGVTAVYQLMILDNFLPESNKSELSQ